MNCGHCVSDGYAKKSMLKFTSFLQGYLAYTAD